MALNAKKTDKENTDLKNSKKSHASTCKKDFKPRSP